MKPSTLSRFSIVITRILSPIVFVSFSLCILIVFVSDTNHRYYFPNYLFSKSDQVYKSNEAKLAVEFDLKQKRDAELFAWSELFQSWTLRPNIRAAYENESQSSKNCIPIWPKDCKIRERSNDRIVNQLKLSRQTNKIFKILPPAYSSYPTGGDIFLSEGCLVNRCQITYDSDEADTLIFQNSDVLISPSRRRRSDQIWIAYLLESPFYTFDKKFTRLHRGKHQFNWTASYRSDSDIVTPYSKFVPYSDQVSNYHSLKSNNKRNLSDIQHSYADSSPYHKSLISRKKGKIAWFASNCNAANNRLEYARELARFIQVDIYGKCGNLTCDKWNQTGCSDMINKNYKFYLSFENSNCRQYITEKLFRNAYGYNDLNHLVLPIVMGAPKNDYNEFAPPASFIHVDDFKSAKELAEFLRLLDADDALYYSYFYWKTMGKFIDTKFMCRVCAMLHESFNSGKIKYYPNIKNWWNTYQDTNGLTISYCES